MRVTYFTAGSAGAGHVVRACALLRALHRAGRADVRVTVVAPPSPFLRLARGLGATVAPTAVEVDRLRDRTTAADSAVARALAASQPDVLVVDLFWVPLAFLQLPCPTWLLLRSVPPAWLVGPPDAPFERQRFARIFAIEPAPVLQAFEQMPPVVVVAPGERGTRGALAAAVGLDERDSLRVIARGGLPSDADALRAAAAATADGRWGELDLHLDDALFPAAPLLAAADHVVAAPGYNTFWESRLLGFDDRTTWVPISRRLDDVQWRARLPPTVRPRENGADALAQALVRG